ncbi:hypothetical protein SAMN06297251_106118 [Fulvimarina manganoxydans]|uniref:Uncharacterized protein n=1 Tax=Fulvimarina manganoxydans TaxID=937218 RepID=A0A1W2BF42_9HYPH|nr:hypothetical protein SAMN06297251_106118 [Fulvimarina manganoxydans]
MIGIEKAPGALALGAFFMRNQNKSHRHLGRCLNLFLQAALRPRPIIPKAKAKRFRKRRKP